MRVQKFCFTIEPEEPLVLPAYKGSALRGAFGHAFRKIICALRKEKCLDCLLREKCIYSYVFETPPPSGTKIMRKYTSAPHPFVLEPPLERKREYAPGDAVSFGLLLIGKAIDYLPYFIYAFDEMGKTGLGAGKGKFTLGSVVRQGMPGSSGDETVYSADTKTFVSTQNRDICLSLTMDKAVGDLSSPLRRLSLEFLTPARISYDGHLTDSLEFHVLIRNLLRRIALLCYFHCEGDPSGWDFKKIIESAEKVRIIKSDLRWHDWERYSARQDTRMKMGGVIGKITYEGEIGPFMPLIRAGEIAHVGKGTSFGLGKYGIEEQ
ncbi:MAG: CRISPR system precrRNA processing endoribonuclease RAMP protein Cas6 [Nitrospirales bacterium]|nr:CRISPR system precrRNA processing endoribonuclease RAMP protein Cas6 [Nitrospirales bacterium]